MHIIHLKEILALPIPIKCKSSHGRWWQITRKINFRISSKALVKRRKVAAGQTDCWRQPCALTNDLRRKAKYVFTKMWFPRAHLVGAILKRQIIITSEHFYLVSKVPPSTKIPRHWVAVVMRISNGIVVVLRNVLWYDLEWKVQKSRYSRRIYPK